MIAQPNSPPAQDDKQPTRKIKTQLISIRSVGTDGPLGDRSLLTCSFCDKRTVLPTLSRSMVDKLSRREHFCRFCLRNDFHLRSNRNILIMSFRSVIGYLYYNNYKSKDRKRAICYSQLLDFIRVHEQSGLTNPVFYYDPESFLWFVDFNKVGSVGRKIPVSSVHKTVINILSCFNLYDIAPYFRMSSFYKKYAEAIEVFYATRSRPDGKKILTPTFHACGVNDTKELPFEKTRIFVPQDMRK